MDLPLVGDRFELEQKIASGSNGNIYRGINIETGERVAVKLESIKAKDPQLLYESKVYKHLVGAVGIPNIHWYGSEGDWNVMVLDLLGPTLEELLNFCNRKFTVKTTLMLADQMLTRIEHVQTKDFVHADIIPENFLIGLGKRSKIVHLIDFGLAKRYRHPSTQRHIEYMENQTPKGSARFGSVNTSRGVHQYRRDDVESLGYILMYFLRSTLPWQSLKGNTKKETYAKILQKKTSISAEVLCESFPRQLAMYFNYIRGLNFDDRPDYSYLRRLCKDALVQSHEQHDYLFDWIVLNYDETEKISGQ